MGYAGSGKRDYAARPVPPYRRGLWEFQLVARGACAVTLAAKEPPLPAPARSLWVFGPDCVHGWTGAGRAGCEIAVLHFDRVPPALLRRLGARAWVRVDLRAEEVRAVEAMAREAPERWNRPVDLRELHASALLSRLALLVIERDPEGVTERAGPARKVEQALAWLRAHLHEGPALEDAARAAGVSRQHLRRLFHETLGKSPREAFHELRIERARELLRDPELKQEAIAQACGYSCAAAFSRAYHAATRARPGAWRRG